MGRSKSVNSVRSAYGDKDRDNKMPHTPLGIGKGRADLREYEYKVPVNANYQ